MKIIEAMKRIKANKAKILDLQGKIAQVSAHLSHETPLYGVDTPEKIKEWIQSCEDCSQENIRLLTAIARTNLVTEVTVNLGNGAGTEKAVTKTIAEWIWRRREYANLDFQTWSRLTDRNLKEGSAASSTGIAIEVKLVRNYDPDRRDKKMNEYKNEPYAIDAALEVKNAVTDLIE